MKYPILSNPFPLFFPIGISHDPNAIYPKLFFIIPSIYCLIGIHGIDIQKFIVTTNKEKREEKERN